MMDRDDAKDRARPMGKVLFVLAPDEGIGTETLWAKDLGEGLFELDNTPWYANGCALGDVVRCKPTARSPAEFVEVVRPSGNRTVRVFVPAGDERTARKEEIFAFLKSAGCMFEGQGADNGLIAVTIPPSAPMAGVLRHLSDLAARGEAFWESGNF
jgi:hypothetical protein